MQFDRLDDHSVNGSRKWTIWRQVKTDHPGKDTPARVQQGGQFRLPEGGQFHAPSTPSRLSL
jgi:hypothetical protein